MINIVQKVWGYILIVSVIKFLSSIISFFLNINSFLLVVIITIIFLCFYRILPMEYSDYPLGFRIELRNLDLR